MTALLDANVLIVLAVTDHVHHGFAEDWFVGRTSPFATCPVTQGALVWFLLREGSTAIAAIEVMRGLSTSPGHEFWVDDLAYDSVDLGGVVGHRQVTDAYLCSLARSHGGRLVTLDRALALLHNDVADLVGGRSPPT